LTFTCGDALNKCRQTVVKKDKIHSSILTYKELKNILLGNNKYSTILLVTKYTKNSIPLSIKQNKICSMSVGTEQLSSKC
jgi:hypothetical protein